MNIAKSSNKILFSAKSIWILKIFRDKITIEKDKIKVEYGLFFLCNNVIQILAKDILSVEVDTGPLSSDIIITLEGYQEKTLEPVRRLSHTDAVKVRRILTGLMVQKKHNN